MNPRTLLAAATELLTCAAALCTPAGIPATPEPRLREVIYSALSVVTVPVRRGIVTHVVLDGDETIREVAAGLGGDCLRADSAWCVVAQAGDRHLFIKPKSTASAANNLAVVTDQRVHAFRFEVLSDKNPHPPVYRLRVKAPSTRKETDNSQEIAAPTRPFSWPPHVLHSLQQAALQPPLSDSQVVAERLHSKAQPINTQYSMAEGSDSQEILPSLVFDDGRFTYLQYPGNREVPAVFQVQGDGSENVVNARMEDDMLVIDRVSRRWMLRTGAAVIGLWNDAFDLDGNPPSHGTTVPGVVRSLKPGFEARRAAKSGGLP